MSTHDRTDEGEAPAWSGTNAPEDALSRWLLDAALNGSTAGDLVEGLNQELLNHGVRVDRCHVTFSVLHPLFEAEGVTWTSETGPVSAGYDHLDGGRNEGWLRSPIRYVVAHRASKLRLQLTGPDAASAMEAFPVLETFASEGFSDYVAFSCPFQSFTGYSKDRDPVTSVSGMAVTWCTKADGGFTEAELAVLEGLVPMTALAIKTTVQDKIALAVAQTYLGAGAGRRVLDGSIHLGDGSLRPSVVLFADLRESSGLSERVDHRRFLAQMNRFFSALSEGVDAEGGEIVSFLGDGALAVFPLDDFGESEARAAAMRAVETTVRAIERSNAEPDSVPMRFGMGLHVGDVLHGNIGVRHRMTWSVLGQVVNEAARLQELTKAENAVLIASDAFVSKATEPNGGAWVELGARQLRGLTEPITIHAWRPGGVELAPE